MNQCPQAQVSSGFALLLASLLFNPIIHSVHADEIKLLHSPNQRIEVQLKVINSFFHATGKPVYNISFNGNTLIDDSQLGLNFQNSGALDDVAIKSESHQSGVADYSIPFGKTSSVSDAYEEYAFLLAETNAPRRELRVVFRIFNDGVAFRYELPEQEAFKDFVIQDELTQINITQRPRLMAPPLYFGSAYEAYYRTGPIEVFGSWDHLGLPFLMQYSNGPVVAVTEANLLDYAGLYFSPSAKEKNMLQAALAPSLQDKAIKVKGTTPFLTPWRVFMIGDSPKTLLESNIVTDLADPSTVADTSWIHPGKIQFPWWNGYVVPHPDPQFKPGLNTWTLKHYIDFCARNNVPYHSIDGFDQAWYGGPVDPFSSDSVTRAIPDIDLPEVLSYAKKKGVGTRLWMHSVGLASDLDHALATYESWGIEGIMVDFFNRDDQDAVRWYNQVLKKAAEHHLTVTFHGVFKPTGQTRTYPHLLNHEAVLGTEYNKWSDTGETPEHELNIAFIRNLAGPLDTHEGSFRPVSLAGYHKSFIAPQAMGTLARQLALYVVYENHLPMLADYPEAYEAHLDAFQFLKEVPVYWDETRMLSGQLEKYIVMGRRKGSEWYVGGINNRDPLIVDLPLDFLGTGNYIAEIYSDAQDSEVVPEDIIIKKIPVTASDHLNLQLVMAGGQAIRFYPQLR